NSESTIECDTVILAIGQAPRLDFLTPEDGVEISGRGLIVADRNTLMTTAPKIEVEFLDHHSMLSDFMNLSREPVPMLPLDRRTGVTEVETGYDEAAAMREARRCLRCWINTVFEGNEPDGSQCVLCGGCVDVCPENCI